MIIGIPFKTHYWPINHVEKSHTSLEEIRCFWSITTSFVQLLTSKQQHTFKSLSQYQQPLNINVTKKRNDFQMSHRMSIEEKGKDFSHEIFIIISYCPPKVCSCFLQYNLFNVKKQHHLGCCV